MNIIKLSDIYLLIAYLDFIKERLVLLVGILLPFQKYLIINFNQLNEFNITFAYFGTQVIAAHQNLQYMPFVHDTRITYN